MPEYEILAAFLRGREWTCFDVGAERRIRVLPCEHMHNTSWIYFSAVLLKSLVKYFPSVKLIPPNPHALLLLWQQPFCYPQDSKTKASSGSYYFLMLAHSWKKLSLFQVQSSTSASVMFACSRDTIKNKLSGSRSTLNHIPNHGVHPFLILTNFPVTASRSNVCFWQEQLQNDKQCIKEKRAKK